MRGRNEFVSKGRAALCLGAFLLLYGGVMFRAFDLQILDHDYWSDRAKRQQHTSFSVTGERGGIFDREGNPLAISTAADSIYVDPRRLTSPAEDAVAMAKALGSDAKELARRFKGDRHFVWVKRQASPTERDAVEALGMEGVGMVTEYRRYYPNGETAGQLLGFTGIDRVGLEGLERHFDSYLKADDLRLVAGRDARGAKLLDGEQILNERRRGDRITLTIDRNLQFIAERELAAALEAAGAVAGTVVMLDPATGEVLAMANAPAFNPNNVKGVRASMRNRAVLDMFEPGSTFKLFLVAAALNEGVVTPETVIDCENGRYRVADKVIHDTKPHGKLTVAEVLKVSSNIGCVKIAQKLGKETYYRYLDAFGFGKRTGIDLPAEAAGALRPADTWYEVDLATAAFGQGVSVTSMQMATAVAAIINGGDLQRPYLVDRIESDRGELVKGSQRGLVRSVIAPKTAQMLRKMMVGITESGGTATLARVDGYVVGGKTGTAQKHDAIRGGYSDDLRVASFVGFAPADDPKMVIAVMIDEPKEKVYGGLIAAPVFSKIAGQALHYLNIAADGEQQSPLVASAPAEAGETRAASYVAGAMPNLTGMSLREVLRFMERTGINVKLNGSGRVISQSPVAGEPLPTRDVAWVTLQQPN